MSDRPKETRFKVEVNREEEISLRIHNNEVILQVGDARVPFSPTEAVAFAEMLRSYGERLAATPKPEDR